MSVPWYLLKAVGHLCGSAIRNVAFVEGRQMLVKINVRTNTSQVLYSQKRGESSKSRLQYC